MKGKRHLRPEVIGLACIGLTLASGFARVGAASPVASARDFQKPGRDANAPVAAEIEVLPDSVLAHIMRGNHLGGLKRYDEAVDAFYAAIKTAGRPVYTAYLNMGYVLFNKGDYARAVEAYRQALSIKPNSCQCHYNLGEALYANQDYAGAEKEYRRVLELRAGGLASRARHFLGLALYKQKRIDEAIAEYLGAIEQAGGIYSEAHYNLGIALLERGQAPAAEREFRLAIEQEKSWPEAHYNLAQALENQRRYREAADEYDVYLKLMPAGTDSADMRKYIDYLRRKK
jgi:tetratricopeptide (TPR) repeat protein